MSNAQQSIISLDQWREQMGITACTVWRWRKKGWLEVVNICGRLYVSQEAIAKFNERARSGEFSQIHKAPVRNPQTGVPA